MSNKNKEFENISIPKWKLAMNGVQNAAQKVYRVFKENGEFVTVEAESATEAAIKSGFDKVKMIKTGYMDDMTMLDRSMLSSEPPSPPPVTA